MVLDIIGLAVKNQGFRQMTRVFYSNQERAKTRKEREEITNSKRMRHGTREREKKLVKTDKNYIPKSRKKRRQSMYIW